MLDVNYGNAGWSHFKSESLLIIKSVHETTLSAANVTDFYSTDFRNLWLENQLNWIWEMPGQKMTKNKIARMLLACQKLNTIALYGKNKKAIIIEVVLKLS